MREIKAPARPLNVNQSTPTIFLAGSIDMGKAVDWQKQITDALQDTDVVVFNPRRDDWDSTWEQDISNEQFRTQVEWELDHLETADIIVYVFEPKGKAPITLLELGLYAGRREAARAIIVCCPEGYWRRGNVQVVCSYYSLPLVDTVDEVISELKNHLEDPWNTEQTSNAT